MGQLRTVEVILTVVTDKPQNELSSASTWDKVHKGYLKIVGTRVHSDTKGDAPIAAEVDAPDLDIPAGGEDMA